MKRAIVILIIIAAVGAGAGAYYMRRGNGEVTINTAAITRGEIIDTVGSTGTLQAVTTVQVGSQVSGNISWLGADFNSIVKKGQVIARLDPSLLAAQVDQSKANLLKAQADVSRAQADVQRNRVALIDSQQKYARAKELAAKQLLPQADLDAAKVAVDSAESSLQSSIAAQAVKIYAVSGAVRNARLVCCSCGQRNCAAQETTAIGVIERIPEATPSRKPNTMSIAGV